LQQNTLESTFTALSLCGKRALEIHPYEHGRVVLVVELGRSGEILRVQVQGANTDREPRGEGGGDLSRKTIKCMIHELEQMGPFAFTGSAANVIFTLPIELDAQCFGSAEDRRLRFGPVHVGSFEVSGGDVLRTDAIVQSMIQGFFRCRTHYLPPYPLEQRHVQLYADIHSDGQVHGSGAREGHRLSNEMIQCLLRVIALRHFTVSAVGGEKVRLSFLVTFEASTFDSPDADP
jgi:hypothetical protein